VIVPDVLIQPNSASLEMVFYQGFQFLETYRGGVVAAEHGSWNRTVPVGYEVIFVPFQEISEQRLQAMIYAIHCLQCAAQNEERRKR
jgi:glucose/arabinose dehydrogenase